MSLQPATTEALQRTHAMNSVERLADGLTAAIPHFLLWLAVSNALSGDPARSTSSNSAQAQIAFYCLSLQAALAIIEVCNPRSQETPIPALMFLNAARILTSIVSAVAFLVAIVNLAELKTENLLNQTLYSQEKTLPWLVAGYGLLILKHFAASLGTILFCCKKFRGAGHTLYSSLNMLVQLILTIAASAATSVLALLLQGGLAGFYNQTDSPYQSNHLFSCLSILSTICYAITFFAALPTAGVSLYNYVKERRRDQEDFVSLADISVTTNNNNEPSGYHSLTTNDNGTPPAEFDPNLQI